MAGTPWRGLFVNKIALAWLGSRHLHATGGESRLHRGARAFFGAPAGVDAMLVQDEQAERAQTRVDDLLLLRFCAPFSGQRHLS